MRCLFIFIFFGIFLLALLNLSFYIKKENPDCENVEFFGNLDIFLMLYCRIMKDFFFQDNLFFFL